MEEIKSLRKECYRLVELILRKGKISKPDLFIALAFRLRLPIDNCYIKDFDETMCKKAIKELNYMLEI